MMNDTLLTGCTISVTVLNVMALKNVHVRTKSQSHNTFLD
jgi:hypothetical protein